MFNRYHDPEITTKNAICKLVVVLALIGTISSLFVVAREQSKYSRFQDNCLRKFEDASNTLVVVDARIALEHLQQQVCYLHLQTFSRQLLEKV